MSKGRLDSLRGTGWLSGAEDVDGHDGQEREVERERTGGRHRACVY